MNNEIKEILDNIKNKYEDYYVQDIVSGNDLKQILDYITNLQQENEYLKMNNPEQNIEHFRIINENKRKINNLRKQNKELLKKSYSDDIRITKAVEFIKEKQETTDIDDVINTDILLNILQNGRDEE